MLSSSDDQEAGHRAHSNISSGSNTRNALHVNNVVSSGAEDDDESFLVSGADDVQAAQKERSLSMISDDGHGIEKATRTPWRAFFTHPASITLLVNNWVFVSSVALLVALTGF